MTTDQSIQSAGGLLTLTAFKGIGPKTAFRLAERFSTFDAIRGADDQALSGIEQRLEMVRRLLKLLVNQRPRRACMGDFVASEAS